MSLVEASLDGFAFRRQPAITRPRAPKSRSMPATNPHRPYADSGALGGRFPLDTEAGDGNRTRTKSLEGSCATVTPRPRPLALILTSNDRRHATGQGASS